MSGGATDGLGRKIATAGELKTVVRSMKALAASSIGQYERAVLALDDYYRTVELGLVACLKLEPRFPAGKGSKAGAVGAVMVGSDQGLVGRFNEVVLEFAGAHLKSVLANVNHVWAVGERMHALVRDSALPASTLLPVPNSIEGIAPLVGELLIAIEASLGREHIREIFLFHNCRASAATYEPIVKRLLPLDSVWENTIAARPWPGKNLSQVIDGAAPALDAFVREYLFILLFQACAQSLVSEHASRLAAMQRAEKNIEEILEVLNRSFHRIRQESIDEELFEVISGYDALRTVAAPASSPHRLR